MAQVRDYNKLAHDIIREVGGAQNIVNATRCATKISPGIKRNTGRCERENFLKCQA